MSDDENDIDFEPEDELGSLQSLKNKLAKIRDELEVVKKERQEYLDGWQRAKAESVNQRREAALEYTRAGETARENLVAEIIPALDSFFMAMQSEQWSTIDGAWRTGVESIYSQLVQALAAGGIQQYGAVGDMFDPALHEPIQEIEGGTAHTVARVFRPGYRSTTRIIRPTQVILYK